MEMDSTCLGDYMQDLLRLKICNDRNNQSFPSLKPEGLTPVVAFSEAHFPFL